MKDFERAAAKLQSNSSREDRTGKTSNDEKCSESITQGPLSSEFNVDLNLGENREDTSEGADRSDKQLATSGSSPTDPSEVVPISAAVTSIRENTNNSSNDPLPEFKRLDIPLKKLRRSGYVTPSDVKNKMTEEYRRIKRPLVRNLTNDDISKNSHVLMVTSSIAGEGKTFTSINLTMSLAQERERNVIFIDADVLKGTAGSELGLPRHTPGLIDVLSGAVSEFHEVVHETNVPNLWFVPAGQSNTHANELLASDGLGRCIDEISTLFEDSILILDCPPILQTNEANVLLHHAGQVVFIVAERQTNQKLVSVALNQIDESKYLGLVLNRSRNTNSVYGYGYV